jgi:hypothetical protein
MANSNSINLYQNFQNGDLIDTDLKPVKRWGFKWCLLCLATPFYTLFGKDAFSHLRAKNVADAIFKHVDKHPELNTVSKKIYTVILQKLKDSRPIPFFSLPTPSGFIEDGYGEFIVVNTKGKQISRKVHDQAYKVFIECRDLENRKEGIETKLKEIDSNLHAVFVPRTLYELTFYQEIIERTNKNEMNEKASNEERTSNESQFKLLCKDARKNKMGHNFIVSMYMGYDEPLRKKKEPITFNTKIPTFEDAGDNFNEDVVKLAYMTNQLFEKHFKGEKGAFSMEKISTLLEEKIAFFAKFCTVKHNCTSQIGHFFTHFGQGEVDSEQRKNVIRKQIALECSKVAKNAFLLCRGASLLVDSTKRGEENLNLSFGTSLFAGVQDPTATPFYYMGNRYMKTNDGYTIVVPKEKADKTPFVIPKTHTLCQIAGICEAFHASTKTPKGKKYHRVGITPLNEGLSIKQSASSMNHEELEQAFQDYKSKAVLLTA